MFPVRTREPLRFRGGGNAESGPMADSGSHRHNKKKGAPQPVVTVPSPAAASPTTTLTGGGDSSPTLSKRSFVSEPPTPRPIVTIYTAFDDEDDPLSPTQKPHGAGSPKPTAPPSAATTLLPTVTSLSPEHHIAMYGNGLSGPDFVDDVARPLTMSSRTSFHVDPGDGLGNSPSPPPAASMGSCAPTASLADFSELDDGYGASGVRYSATPVVPLNVGADAHFRRGAALKFEHRIQKAAAETAALAAKAEAERKAKEAAAKAIEEANARLSKREREKKEKREKKERERQKASEPLAAPPAQKLTGKALKEYLVRVGIERISQRASDLHLQLHRVRNDGNCQFRAISHQLFGSEAYHDIVRSHVVSYMRSVRAQQFDFYFESQAEADQYFHRISSPGAWGDELTLRGASDSLHINIHILSSEVKNCFITYRPSESAPPPPAFLVDVTTLRERRQRERSYASRPASRVPSMLRPRGDSCGKTADGAAAATAAADDDDDAPIDAAAIQQALERRLEHASIVTATPCVSTANSLAASFARPSSSMVPPPPPPPIPTSAPTDRLTGLDAHAGSRSDLDKFTKAGATVKDHHADGEDMSLLMPRPDKATLVSSRPPPLTATTTTTNATTASAPGPLLRPLAPAASASATVLGGSGSAQVSPLYRQPSQTSSFSVWPNNQSSFPDSHPSFPTKEGGHVLLVAAPRPRKDTGNTTQPQFTPTRAAPSQSASLCQRTPVAGDHFAPVSPCDPHIGSCCSPSRSFDAANAMCSPVPETEVGVCFEFEKRTEPIDIFLSYLFPVHYNSIVLMENSFASPTSATGPGELPTTPAPSTAPTAASTDAANDATHNHHSDTDVQPSSPAAEASTATSTAVLTPQSHLVTIPFLKPQAS